MGIPALQYTGLHADCPTTGMQHNYSYHGRPRRADVENGTSLTKGKHGVAILVHRDDDVEAVEDVSPAVEGILAVLVRNKKWAQPHLYIATYMENDNGNRTRDLRSKQLAALTNLADEYRKTTRWHLGGDLYRRAYEVGDAMAISQCKKKQGDADERNMLHVNASKKEHAFFQRRRRAR